MGEPGAMMQQTELRANGREPLVVCARKLSGTNLKISTEMKTRQMTGGSRSAKVKWHPISPWDKAVVAAQPSFRSQYFIFFSPFLGGTGVRVAGSHSGWACSNCNPPPVRASQAWANKSRMGPAVGFIASQRVAQVAGLSSCISLQPGRDSCSSKLRLHCSSLVGATGPYFLSNSESGILFLFFLFFICIKCRFLDSVMFQRHLYS